VRDAKSSHPADPPPRMGLTEEEIFGLFDIQARPKRIAA